MMEAEQFQLCIQSRQDQGTGVAVLELVDPAGKALPEFKAGAHIDVHIGDDFIRQYSLCNDPQNRELYRIGVLNDPNSRGGSVKLHQDFKDEGLVTVSAPRNHFPLVSSRAKTILAGGGIGITPMIAMAYELQAQKLPFELHYCMRTAGAGAFERELTQNFGEHLVFHYDDQDKSQLFSPQNTLEQADKDSHIYVCGPTGFMDWVIDSAKQYGLPSEHIHFEYFNADVDATGEAFEVYCAQSDITVRVNESDTIAKALISAGVKVNVSCEQGICGTCISDVLEGEPDHRDQFLSDEEKDDNDQIALCCSRAKSQRLVVDI